MEAADLLNQHGPTGLLVAVALLFLRQLFAGGIQIKVKHDEKQVEQLTAAVLEPVQEMNKRLKHVEDVAQDVQQTATANKQAIGELTVKLEERTALQARKSAPAL